MSPAYLLRNVLVVNPREFFPADIRIARGKILDLSQSLSPRRNEPVIDCTGFLASPGLINSHDHLQFNLYSRIGNPPYQNSYEWGNDIRTNFRNTVELIENVPVRLRYLWGAWKNLFSGVTQVVHHDPYSHHFRFRFPIDVFRRYTFAHSLGNERDIDTKLARRRQSTPFILHLAEGIDGRTATEVQALQQLGGLDERTVAVHLVNITQRDIDTLSRTKCSAIWCPSSNHFMLGKTAPVELLLNRIPLALGTDSTLTGSITMFDEMRCAQSVSGRTPREIFQMVTEFPQKIFGLRHGSGQIVRDECAELFLLPITDADPYNAILRAQPEDIALLFRRGKIVFYDHEYFPALTKPNSRNVLMFGSRKKTISSIRCMKLFNTMRSYLQHYLYLAKN